MLLLAQAASPPPANVIDLTSPANTCAPSEADEVVICGSRERSPYRLPELPRDYQPKSTVAEAQLAPGVRARAVIESVDLLGAQSDRLLVRLTIGF